MSLTTFKTGLIPLLALGAICIEGSLQESQAETLPVIRPAILRETQSPKLVVPPAPSSDEPIQADLNSELAFAEENAETSGQHAPADNAGGTVEELKAPISEAEESRMPQSTTVTFDDGWTMTITPGPRSTPLHREYEEIYNSIPFRRSEYLANPSYRHDTTVELMFGEMRPTVVHRNDTPQRVQNPRPDVYRPYIPSTGELYRLTRPYLYSAPYVPFFPF